VDNGQCAVFCLDGDELVTLKHCELRSSSGALFDSHATTEPYSDGAPRSSNSSIYTLNCTTDAACEGELRRYAWCGRPGKTKPALQSTGGSSHSLSEDAIEDVVVGSRKRARDE
jgi:hypothetical protein